MQSQGNTFEGILNFRDVGDGIPGIKKGFFFRSASGERASKNDLKTLLKKYQIITMIDLRSDRERRSDSDQSPIYSAFTPVHSLRQSRQVQGRKIFQMRFIGTSFITHLFTGAPLSVSMKASSYLARGDPEKATLLLVASLNSRGLLNLYNMFLENCKGHLCDVLQTFLDPLNYPVHVFCNLGKDRTGLITALVLSCVGVPREQICADYARSSEVNLTRSMRDIIGAVSENVADASFLSAPPEIMQKTLEYLDIKYGSVYEYLVRIGFDKYKQAQLRALLSTSMDVPLQERGIIRCKSTPEFAPTTIPGAQPELSKEVEAITLSVKGAAADKEPPAMQKQKDLLVPPQMTEAIRQEGHREGFRERYRRRVLTGQHMHSSSRLDLMTGLTGPYLTPQKQESSPSLSVAPADLPTAPAIPETPQRHHFVHRFRHNASQASFNEKPTSTG